MTAGVLGTLALVAVVGWLRAARTARRLGRESKVLDGRILRLSEQLAGVRAANTGNVMCTVLGAYGTDNDVLARNEDPWASGEQRQALADRFGDVLRSGGVW